jgi:hypothetical protein
MRENAVSLPTSQMVQACASGERNNANNAWLELANDAFYLIGSAVVQRVKYY